MAGIAWGVASMVLIVAMGDGFKVGQRDRFRQLGENIVIVFNGRTEMQAGGRRAGRRIRLDYTDVRDIRAECWLVKRGSGGVAERRPRREPVQQRIVRRDGGGGDLLRDPQRAGGPRAFPAEQDDRDAARVAVLGDNVRKQLFGEHPVGPGDTLAINGLPFRIVGLMPPKDPEQQLQRPGQRQDLRPLLHHGARPAVDRRQFPPRHRQRPDLRAGLPRPSSKRRANR